jgi:hypothetical protein
MALKHLDGFDLGVVATQAKYDVVGGTTPIEIVEGRVSAGNPTRAAVIRYDAYLEKQGIDLNSSPTLGAAVKFMVVPDNDKAVFKLRHGTTDLCVLRFRRDRRLGVYRGNGNILVGTPTAPLPLNQWMHLQWLAVLSPYADGQSEVYLDGVLATAAYTTPTMAGTGEINTLRIGDGYPSQSEFWIDDLWVDDQNLLRGDLRVLTKKASADADPNDWDGAAPHAALVADADRAGSYVSTSLDGAVEMFDFPAVTGDALVHGLATTVVAKAQQQREKVDLTGLIDLGDGTVYEGPANRLPGQYAAFTHIQEGRPDTYGEWVLPQVGTTKFGFRYDLVP